MPTSNEQPTVIKRREAIRRALAAAGAGYVAPMILGTATPASAQVSGGLCMACEGLPPFAVCATGCSCYNRADTPFNQVCVADLPVDGQCGGTATTCDTADQCGPGELCINACGTGTFAGKCHACCEISAPV